MTFRTLALFAAMLLVLPAAPAGAFDVFLDHNTDNDPSTFSNLVEGAISAPVDVIVSITPADLGVSTLSFVIKWGYGPPSPGGSQGCFDVKGSILGWEPGLLLPDSGPFTNIEPLQCICRELRCFCAAELLIQANVNVTQPGNYVLASLVFTRSGLEESTCNSFTWAQSDFEVICGFPSCDTSGDPRAKMTITDGATAVESSTWGRVKSLYQ
ncbi:MAG TPA: hypothetical protein VKU85_01560 [bacterium]|nr:hypothetical protein [bacterium]